MGCLGRGAGRSADPQPLLNEQPHEHKDLLQQHEREERDITSTLVEVGEYMYNTV